MPNPPPEQADPASRLGRWLALGALSLIVPLALALIEPIADPLREPVHISAGWLWASAMAAALAGASLVLLRRGRDVGRRGAAMGGALASLVLAGGIAYGAAAGPLFHIAECSRLPLAGPGTADGRALVDGMAIESFSGVALDGDALSALIGRLDGVPVEDHGVERVGGVPARRCSMLVSGSHALAAFPPLASLGGDLDRPLGELPVWRGELEWWTDAAGQLIMARVDVGGHPADAWGSRGLRGELFAELRPVRGDAP